MMYNPEALHRDVESSYAERPKVPVFYDANEHSESRLPLSEYALKKEISLPHQPFEYNDTSPTPLDPYRLYAKDFPYFSAASLFMNWDVKAKSLGAGLEEDSPVVHSISNEVDFQHLHRSQKNDESMDRLRRSLIQPLTPYEAEVVMRIRAGVADAHEPALLLAKVPEMGGIEAMKATRVFDHAAVKRANSDFMSNLVKAEYNNRHLQIDRLYNPLSADQISLRNLERERIDDDKNVFTAGFKDSVAVMKWVQADLLVDGMPVELVSRNSYVLLPPEIYLEGIKPHMMQLPDGHVANLQPIDVTKYYRIKKDADSFLRKKLYNMIQDSLGRQLGGDDR